VDGAGMGGVFQLLFLLVGELAGDFDFDAEFADAAHGRGDHFFLDGDLGAFDINVHVARGNAHDGEHAGAEGGSDKVGRRKAFALAVVILGRIRMEASAGRLMDGFVAEVAFIFDVNGHHRPDILIIMTGFHQQIPARAKM
jgi:hypothetical protein